MSLKTQFLLNPEITFLNFGSFGACPEPVFKVYQDFQLELERDPVQFILNKGPQYLKESRISLAELIVCEPDDLVYTPNPTYAVNIIAKNLRLKPGDEILSTDLEYGAMDRTWKYYCEKAGAKYVRQPITLPLVSKEKFIEEFWKGFSSKTKAIFISEITSSTALIFPVKEICEEAKERGLITIVDGAHVPGHIDLNLSEMRADIYTGACHKWMLTPKGSSFLYVKKEFQEMMEPLVVSWGYDAAFPSESQFLDYHEFTGTRDFSAYLTIPAARDFMKWNDWERVKSNCRKLVYDNIPRFCELLNTSPLAPVRGEFFGQMASIPIKTKNPAELKQLLFNEYKTEIPVMPHGENVYLRYSINAFNSQEDLDILFEAVTDLKKKKYIL